MTAWHHDPANAQLVHRLRSVVAGKGRLLVFLGAGLSFGAARLNARVTFDYDHYDRWWPHDFPQIDLVPDDDGLPLPSWPWLVSRMCREIMVHSSHRGAHLASIVFHRGRAARLCAVVSPDRG